MGSNFQYSKNLAMEGSILLILGVVPYVGWVLGIIGIILLMRGIKELANYYQDNAIYQNALTGVKYYIIALIAAAVAVTSIVIGVGSATDFKFKNFVLTPGFAVSLMAFFAGLIIAFIFFILASTNLRKTFETLAQKSGEHSFATAGMLLWWGSILTIIGVGFIVIFIAWIFAVVGFFTMKAPQQQPYTSQPYGNIPPVTQPSAQSSTATRYCSNCGAPIASEGTYCSHCGKEVS